MTNVPTQKPARGLQYYMRAVHRVLGYLAVGMVIAYSLSGIVLIHRTGDFMRHYTTETATLSPGLDAEGVAAEMRMRPEVTEETPEAIVFDWGRYSKTTGEVSYQRKSWVSPMDKMVNLHKLPDAKDHHIAAVTTLFGVVLFLLAVTSLFMYKTRSRQFRANMIYTAIGVALTVLLIAIV